MPTSVDPVCFHDQLPQRQKEGQGGECKLFIDKPSWTIQLFSVLLEQSNQQAVHVLQSLRLKRKWGSTHDLETSLASQLQFCGQWQFF